MVPELTPLLSIVLFLSGVIAGLIVLMATPVLRVGASVGEYLLARDWVFAALTGTVLMTLLASVLVALW